MTLTLVVPKLETSPIAVPTRVAVVDEMVGEFGQEEGQRILREFRVEIR
jgi:hypothetical protein